MNPWITLGMMIIAQSTILAAFALALMRIFRSSAAFKHAIGWTALLGVMISPFTAGSLPSPGWLMNEKKNHVVEISEFAAKASLPNEKTKIESLAPPAESSYKLVPREERPKLNNDFIAQGDSPKLSLSPSPKSPKNVSATAQSVQEKMDWRNALGATLLGIWLIGIGLLVVRFALRLWHLSQIAKASVSTPLKPDLLQRVADLLQGTSDGPSARGRSSRLDYLASQRIAVSQFAPMPIVLGVVRPTVILPSDFFSHALEEQQIQVLTHELAHILRRDPWIHFLQQWVAILFWPHPLIHLLNREIGQAREELCDNYVLRKASPIDYAQTLLELAQRYPVRHSALGLLGTLGLLGLFAKRWSLEDRIRDLLDDRRPVQTQVSSRSRLSVFAIMLAVVCLVGGSNPNGIETWFQRIRETVGANLIARSGSDDPSGTETIPAWPKAGQLPDNKLTIHCECVDQLGQALPGVRVRAFRVRQGVEKVELLQEGKSDAEGSCLFKDLRTASDIRKDSMVNDIVLVADKEGFVSLIQGIFQGTDLRSFPLRLSSSSAAISGSVRDVDGKPIQGASVYYPRPFDVAIPGVLEAVTAEDGTFVMEDLPEMKLQPNSMSIIYADHPNYAKTKVYITSIPSDVEITMDAATFIEGRVIDDVSKKGVTGAIVSSQGIGDFGWAQTRTDDTGRYRLKVTPDYVNVWAEMQDRVAVAQKNKEIVFGKEYKDLDIHMVEGGWVVGRVIEQSTGKPIKAEIAEGLRVASQGPARPLSGAAVLSEPIQADGTFRMRLAPGRNYVYLMNGSGDRFVEVTNRKETKLQLASGSHANPDALSKDPDHQFKQALMQGAGTREKLRREARAKPPKAAVTRSNSEAAELIEVMEKTIKNGMMLEVPWLSAMKDVAELGEDATLDLIAELDATENESMLRSIPFIMRAIGDKRAVPALIRAIPKTLQPPASDYGLIASGADLIEFAQQNDILEGANGNHYDLGRPVRELFATLEKLTGQKFEEDEELYHIFGDGTDAQRAMQRKLFVKRAMVWSDWWENHAKELIDDPAFHKVNLVVPTIERKVAALDHKAPMKTTSGGSNWVLESVFEPNAKTVFFDFDTGRAASLPEKWRSEQDLDKHMDAILAWAESEGFDMMGSEYMVEGGVGSSYALQLIGMQAWELDQGDWKKDFAEIKCEELIERGLPCHEWLMHFDKETKAMDAKGIGTFFCITKDGTPGIIYVGIEVVNNSLQPGGAVNGDCELDPVAFQRGRRFGFKFLMAKDAKEE